MKKLALILTIALAMLIGFMLGGAYEQDINQRDFKAACVLKNVCDTALEHEDLDVIMFEEIFEDCICNVDCYEELAPLQPSDFKRYDIKQLAKASK